MSLHAIPPLFPESSFGWSKSPAPAQLSFFESARQALQALASELQSEFGLVLFVVPAYTCESVVASLMAAGVDVEFVDVDPSLDMNLAELYEVLSNSQHAQKVLLPTSLFGAPLRDYKTLFPGLLVVEDRAQAFLSPASTADFQIVSMGMGKQVSTMGGGVLYSPRQSLSFPNILTTGGSFITSVSAQFLLTKGLKWLWPIFEKIKGSAEEPETPSATVFEPSAPRLVEGMKARWMAHSLRVAEALPRVATANVYHSGLPAHLRFAIPPDLPYLRYPVKAKIQLPGVSMGTMYQNVVHFAEQRRHRACPGARELLSCSLLPTHRLVTPTHQAAYVSALLAAETQAAGADKGVSREPASMPTKPPSQRATPSHPG